MQINGADIDDLVTDLAGLGELYRPPSEIAANKVFSVIDEATADFIARCPFLVVATTNGADSMDASPRGGPPGFLQRLSDRHIAIPDLNGNNRLDSLRNIVEFGRVGLLLVMPGKDETVRINGSAVLTTAPGVLSGFTGELRQPKLAIVVEADELYGHCAKAFRRAGVWNPDKWKQLDEAPDLADIAATQFGLERDDMRAALEHSYVTELAID